MISVPVISSKSFVACTRTILWVCATLVATLSGAVRGQVNLPEGFEIVRFGYTENLCAHIQMNRCGQIVYLERLGPSTADQEIMLYDNGTLRRLTYNNDRDALPRINDSGTMLILRGDGELGVSKLLILEDGRETLFDENALSYGSASLNNHGHIAWSRMTSIDCPIASTSYLWNGRKTIQVSPDDLFDQGESLNDSGQVAFKHEDACANPWVSEIHLFLSKRRTVVMPSPDSQNSPPSLNNAGRAVWESGNDIVLWDGQKLVSLADWGSVPEINDLGDVYFARWDFDRERWQPWLYRVSGGSPTFHRMAANDAYSGRGDVNDWGELAWLCRKQLLNSPHEIWYLRRIRTGDSEFDGDVDANDYRVFASHMTGPDWDELYQQGPQDSLCDGRFLDLDYDGDVDLGDFARFQNAFGARP